MRPLFDERLQVLIFDWANVVARAFSVAGSQNAQFIQLLTEMLMRYRKKFPNWEFVFALEGSGTQRRRKLLPGYKLGSRKVQGKPDHFDTLANEVIRCFACKIIKAEKGEADDAIASFTKKEVGELDNTVIVTEDKDIWQLIKDPSIRVYTRQGDFIDESRVQLKMNGLLPADIRLYKSIMGDKSDNIPKVPLLGQAKAIRLLTGVSTPKELFSKTKKASWLTDKVRQSILACKIQVRLNYKIVGLKYGLELTTKQVKAKPKRLRRLLHSNGVFSLTNSDIKSLTQQGTQL